METTNDNIRKLLEMLDNPDAYTEQEIRDIINLDEETRETYRLMVEAKRSSRQSQTNKPVDIDAAWQRFVASRETHAEHLQKPVGETPASHHRWMRIAAIFIAAAFLTGLSFAAYHAISAKQESERYANEKSLLLTEDGEKVIVTWLKGTWVEKDDGSYIEDFPIVHSPALPLRGDYRATIKVDGKEINVDNLHDVPASLVKKVEIHFSQGKTVNLVTTPVQIPADVKGNINPELTILLTGTPPADSPIKTSLFVKEGIHTSYNWKDSYQAVSWKWQVVDIGDYLEEIAYRKDHHIRVNVCRGVPQKHVDRIKGLMREKGVLRCDWVQQ